MILGLFKSNDDFLPQDDDGDLFKDSLIFSYITAKGKVRDVLFFVEMGEDFSVV